MTDWIEESMDRLSQRWRRREAKIPLGLHIAGMLALAVAAAVGVWACMGSPTLSGNYTGKVALEAAKVVLATVGGLGGVVFLTVAYRRQRGEETAAKREDSRLFNERFVAASNLLSSSAAADQLAGVHAMAGLADDWDAGRQICIDVLCGYVRLPYTPPGDPPPTDGTDDSTVQRFEDRAARRLIRNTIFETIRRRLDRDPSSDSWHEHTFDFRGAVIDGADFSYIEVRGTFDFTGAVFRAGEVSFAHALISGLVLMRGTEFCGSRVDFTGASFGSKTWAACCIDFQGAKFTGGTVDFRGMTLTGGMIDLGFPSSYRVPPRFAVFSEGIPFGLRLPQPFVDVGAGPGAVEYGAGSWNLRDA